MGKSKSDKIKGIEAMAWAVLKLQEIMRVHLEKNNTHFQLKVSAYSAKIKIKQF